MKSNEFQTTLLDWYSQHKRDLPWRKTTDPYHILVSEVMLQQTQVDRVVPKYLDFLQEFPTARKLAYAPPTKVLRLWSGLGYNRRAINLIAAARELSACLERGAVPQSVEEWRALPGIGRYTASAVMAFAANKPVTVIDTNIRRILFRVFVGKPQKEWEKTIEQIAEKLVPEARSRDWHNALMDFGATVCKAKPACEACPLRKQCVSVTKYKYAPEKLEAIASRTFRTRQSPFKGSNRYYRGRILKALHAGNQPQLHHQPPLVQLGKKIKEGFSKKDLPWLHDLVKQLEKDGLVVMREKRIMLPQR